MSESSLRKDRAKAALYARAHIAEYWIIDLASRSVEVLGAPEGDRYTSTRTLGETGTLVARALVDIELRVVDLLPSR